ncbi:MAG TPA: hypothetical protein VJ948_09725 [Acidimicrobiia bacterium]|nr:hypothetical protein [Acidimicrobiia bacterium]
MSVTKVDSDVDNLTTTVVADLVAPVEKVWQHAVHREARGLVADQLYPVVQG